MLDPRRLLLLVDVVRAGSITSAASRLNYTTSAVSQQISKLETEAGQPLLERHARGVRLTEAGAALVRRAERIETQLLAAGTELDDIAGLRSGTVRLGTFPTAGSSLLPPVVKLFKSRHPAIGLTVRSSRFAQLRAMLDAREIEISLLWDYAWDPVNDSELTARVLIIDPPTLVVSVNHRLAKRKKISMDELADEQWITREDTHPVGLALEKACHAAGIHTHRRLRGQRLSGGPSNGGHRPRCLARAAAGTVESARRCPCHPTRRGSPVTSNSPGTPR